MEKINAFFFGQTHPYEVLTQLSLIGYHWTHVSSTHDFALRNETHPTGRLMHSFGHVIRKKKQRSKPCWLMIVEGYTIQFCVDLQSRSMVGNPIDQPVQFRVLYTAGSPKIWESLCPAQIKFKSHVNQMVPALHRAAWCCSPRSLDH